MQRLFLIFAFTFILSLPAFAEWEVNWADSDDNLIYFTTINTNEGSAWLKISSNLEGSGFTISIEVQNIYLSSGNTKIKYTLGNKNNRFTTGEKFASKNLMIFSSKRNHISIINFIDELKNNKQLSITFDDSYDDTHTFIFDISGLQEAFDEVF